MKNIGKRVISSFILLVFCLLTVSTAAPAKEAEAAGKYIKVDEYIKYAVQKMKLPVDETSNTPYIDAAMKAGILKEDDFLNYSSYLTRTDCAVIANRIDKYTYGEHFGYADEVYELLKDCTYLDGKLYYDMENDLYPQGNIYYKAKSFLDDVILPRLSPYFSSNSNLDVVGCDDNDSEGKPHSYVEIGTKGSDPYSVESFEEDDAIVQAWQRIIDGERRIKIVYEKRISDLNKIQKSKRQDVAEVVAKGIIKGFNNGMYIQNRSFRGSKKISVSAAKDVVDMAIDMYKRASLSPDGQLIRTENLPKNASEYPYILECFPNEFYEMVFYFQRLKSFKDGKMDEYEFCYPSETGNKYIMKTYVNFLSPGMEPYEYYDTLMKNVEQYLNCIFRVDYRTVDDKWIKKLGSSYAPTLTSGRGVYDKIDRYLEAMKKNHVVVESKVLSVEPSTLYEYEGDLYIRVYAKYQVIANTIKVEDDYDLLFGSQFGTYLVNLENGEWTYGYYDIALFGSNLIDQSYFDFGVDGAAGISDGALKGSK